MKDWNCGTCFTISTFDIPGVPLWRLFHSVGLGLLCIGMNGWYKILWDAWIGCIALHGMAWNMDGYRYI